MTTTLPVLDDRSVTTPIAVHNVWGTAVHIGVMDAQAEVWRAACGGPSVSVIILAKLIEIHGQPALVVDCSACLAR